MTQIKCENIILRDMIETDIDDYVRWFTTETEWTKWDAPWEHAETEEEKQRAEWMAYYKSVTELSADEIRWRFEIEYNGRHVGWVSSYLIDEEHEWIAASAVQDGQKVHRAIGIDICEKDIWGKGIGTAALRAFIQYCADSGCEELYTQTWSGNRRMLNCAAKLGFEVCNRAVEKREVNGERYDGLTLLLVRRDFP